MKQSSTIQSSFEHEKDDESPVEKLTKFFQKPQAFIMAILVCVILIMSMQFGQL